MYKADELSIAKHIKNMFTKRKRATLSIKDKQIIISHLDKGEKGTNLAQEFGIRKTGLV